VWWRTSSSAESGEACEKLQLTEGSGQLQRLAEAVVGAFGLFEGKVFLLADNL
jgi:hypothetical protein